MNVMRAAVLADYVDLAHQLGLEPEAQLRAVGLSTLVIGTPDRLIPSDAAVRLLENSAAASGCQTLGLRISQLRRMSHFGVVGLLFGQQRTLRDVLQMALRYLPIINGSLAVQLEESDGAALLREEVLTDAAMPVRQAMELSMAANVQLIRSVIRPDWRPRRVYFRHAAPDSLELHKRVFRCPCEFSGEFNAMAFSAGDLELVNPSADPVMAQYALGFIESLAAQGSASFTGDVRRLIYLYLPLGRATIKQVAQSLGRSVRKLQLDLARENAAFGQLLDDVRQERAQLYLDNPRFDMAHVASLLGYGQQGSFTRWFTARFGVAPSAWRKWNAASATASAAGRSGEFQVAAQRRR
jgi:AraC-like DNA-binding protein